jgi:hypothetical protein
MSILEREINSAAYHPEIAIVFADEVPAEIVNQSDVGR